MILDTEEVALKYFLQKLPDTFGEKATKLNGGYCNYVYRVDCAGGHSVVLKNYPPYLATNPSLSFSTSRFDVEVEALRLAYLTENSLVKIPCILLADRECFTLIMEDAGELISLTDCLTRDASSGRVLHPSWPDMTFDKLAQELHNFFSMIHTLGDNPVFRNEAAWEVLRDYMNSFPKVCAKYDIPELNECALKMEAISPTSETGLILGDLWPNTINLNLKTKSIWILDWEMARRGDLKKDVNQLLDNLWIMLHNPVKYHQERIDAFMKALLTCYYGDPEADWRSERRADFIRSIVMLSQFPHWELTDVETIIKQALI